MEPGQVRGDDQGARRLRGRPSRPFAARASSTSTSRPTTLTPTSRPHRAPGGATSPKRSRAIGPADEPARDLRLRRDAGRQRRDDPCGAARDLRAAWRSTCRRPSVCAAGDRAQPDRSHGRAGAGRAGRAARRSSPRITSARSSSCAPPGRSRSRCSTACSSCSTRSRRDGWLLAVATGKSDRGLKHCLEEHGIHARFVSLQTADRHPSQAAPVDGRAGDRRRRRRAGNDDRRRRHQLRHGDGGGRRRDGDRRRLGLSRCRRS